MGKNSAFMNKIVSDLNEIVTVASNSKRSCNMYKIHRATFA